VPPQRELVVDAPTGVGRPTVDIGSRKSGPGRSVGISGRASADSMTGDAGIGRLEAGARADRLVSVLGADVLVRSAAWSRSAWGWVANELTSG
jgi:hypothetical protein